MKRFYFILSILSLLTISANAQFGKIKVNAKQIDAVSKAAQAFTLSDADVAAYCQEYINWMDAHNPVCSVSDKDAGKKAVAKRLEKIKSNIPNISNLKLDIKAYYVIDQNAFACANGSIRVFSGLMDVMTDEEILAVIGHEIGHIVNNDSKDAFKNALLTSALKDAVGSTGSAASALTDSQLGALGESLSSAQFSQKQEYAADEYSLSFLKSMNKDPMSMVAALRVIQKLENDASADKSKSKQLLSSHPDSGKRADKLEKKIKK